MMRNTRTVVLSLAALLLAACLPVLAQTQWDVTRTMHIGGEGA